MVKLLSHARFHFLLRWLCSVCEMSFKVLAKKFKFCESATYALRYSGFLSAFTNLMTFGSMLFCMNFLRMSRSRCSKPDQSEHNVSVIEGGESAEPCFFFTKSVDPPIFLFKSETTTAYKNRS